VNIAAAHQKIGPIEMGGRLPKSKIMTKFTLSASYF
jgi:hypothetical protein